MVVKLVADVEVFDFGNRLKSLREQSNFTQQQIADRLGVTVGTIKKYENNTLLPPVDKLETMAICYKTSLDYLRNLDKRPQIYLDDLSAKQQSFVQEIVEKLKEELNKHDYK